MPRNARRRGLSLIEMLVSLAITALLLAATMVAIDASFRAYAAAAETASRQTNTRLVVHRLLGLVRTSTAHGPLQARADANWPVTFVPGSTDTLQSKYIELIDDKGNDIRLEYRENENELWLIHDPHSASPTAQPLLGGVIECRLYLHRRLDRHGVWVLDRGSVVMKVDRETDNTLAIESGRHVPIEVVASTMPRKLQ